MRTSTFIIGCIFLPIFSCPAAQNQDKTTGKTQEPPFGDAVVEKVLSVDQVYRFRCNIKDWPAIIGQDVPVQIAGLTVPSGIKEQDQPDTFFQTQTKRFLEGILRGAKDIRLENIKRGQSFCLVADVIADSNSVASILIENGFAEKADSKNPSVKTADTEKAAAPAPLKPAAPLYPQLSQDRTKTPPRESADTGYLASKNSKVFHYATCSHARRIAEKNLIHFATRQEAIATGRQPCKTCSP